MSEPFTCTLKVIDSGAPTDSDTWEIFNSVTAWGAKGLRHLPVHRISFGVENSHDGTLKAYMSTDGGANWRQVEGDNAVTAAASDDISGPYDYLVDTYDDFKLDWVNGGTTQTTWDPILRAHEKREPGT